MLSPQKPRLLVTSALPYANGHIHLGHVVEYAQTDIWVRAMRMAGRRVVYVCADDTHGTAVMMRARQEGRSELEIIAAMSEAHQRDFDALQIRFDHYGSTHSDENRRFAAEIWKAFRDAGRVTETHVEQLFDPVEKIFLADRFVKGSCPRCKAKDQYGDNCDKCGATYEATELVDPRSTLSGAVPELATAEHLLVSVEPDRPWITEWTQAEGRMPREMANYLKGFFLGQPFRDWDVSRPAPYFGFEIPDAPGHFFYVWFDAPIGYLAATSQWCARSGESFDDWWRSGDCEVVHFIGKDIVKFHALFWPAMLKLGGFSLPSRLHVHGFLTVNGEKMSKSKGTFVLASTYLAHLDPAYLRYYYASKLGSGVDDLDLNLEEFIQKVNAELVNKVVNLASRSAKFVAQTGLASTYPDDEGLFARAAAEGDEVEQAYEGFDFAKVTRLVVAMADRANEYVDRKAPWALVKQPGKEAEVVEVCSVALNLFRQLVVYLAPILPKLADDVAALFGAPNDSFSCARTPLVGTPVAAYAHLMKRVDPKAVEAMVEASRVEAAAAVAPAEPQAPGAPGASGEAHDDGAALEADPLAPECSIDDFNKVDLRIARVLSAESVPEAKKLLKLEVSLGGDVRRTIFAGIKAHYAPEQLVGKLVVVCANLAPRKMKFGTSEGMVVCAGDGQGVFVLTPDLGAKPGMRVR
jgi:methionyl-tRNA synthetase